MNNKIALIFFTIGFLTFPLAFWIAAETGNGKFTYGSYIIDKTRQMNDYANVDDSFQCRDGNSFNWTINRFGWNANEDFCQLMKVMRYD